MASLASMPRSRLASVPGAARRVAIATTCVAAAVVLAGCNEEPTWGATKGVTKQAHDEFKLWYGMALAGIAVAAIVWALIFWAILRYRRRDDRIPKQFQDHRVLELIYTIVPVIMVVIIFIFTVAVENFMDANPAKPAARIDVTAYQWGWRFAYDRTGGVVVQSANNGHPTTLPRSYFAKQYPTLTLPEGQTSRIYLRSNDVVHGFYVHAFNFSRYALPGWLNIFSFTPTRTGWFPGQCTQYCGLYHSEMLFNVHIVTPAEFRTWLAHKESQLHSPGAVTTAETSSSTGTGGSP